MGAELGIVNEGPPARTSGRLLIYALCVGAVLVVSIGGSWLLGARTRRRKATDMPFESGIIAVGEAEQTRLSIEFYLIAMFFVIFDLETIFIFGWAVAFFELGWRGYVGAAVFIPHPAGRLGLRVAQRRLGLGRQAAACAPGLRAFPPRCPAGNGRGRLGCSGGWSRREPDAPMAAPDAGL